MISSVQCVGAICIGATTIGTGVSHPPPTSWPYQKARNFTASSHQNAWFSIWVFKNFPGVIPPDPIPPDPHSGRGLPYTQHPARPLAVRGAQAPHCWDPNLGPPQLFSHGCDPGNMYSISIWYPSWRPSTSHFRTPLRPLSSWSSPQH